MSRVERHKNEYSKADREAVERIKPSEDPADLKFAYGKNEKAAEQKEQAKPASNAGKDYEVHRKGRAARNKREAQAEEPGILDQTEEEKARARKEARAMGDGRPEFHGGRVLGWLIRLIGTLIIIAAIVACLGLYVPRFAGIGQYAVKDGGMEPAIPAGSMVYSAQVEPSTLSQGDVIVFYANETGSNPVTHRVVENKIADGKVITKGDANAQNDPEPVPYSNIIGKKVLSVPMLGYLAAPMESMLGKVAMGLVIIGAYLLTVIGSKMRKA